MIERPTVLILGAGASADYGFPLGRRLVNAVCEVSNLLDGTGFSSKDVGTFINHLRHADYASVDAFLERFPQYIEVGKACIARALMPYENPRRLFAPEAPPTPSHWYEFLANRLEIGDENLADSRLSVVTFNYDRSLEYYLYKVIEARCGYETPEAAWADLRALPIVHVHGVLGRFLPANEQGLPYGSAARPEQVLEAARNIHVVSDPQEVYNEAMALLEEAERILFLGFGFHPQNVRRLGIFEERWTGDQAATFVSGTAQGISEDEWERIARDRLHGNFNPKPARCRIRQFLEQTSLW